MDNAIQDTQTDKPCILIDGSSFLYRAFHALPAFTNSKGVPTGAIYGVVNMLRKLLAEYQPKLITVIFDAKGKTFRNDIYKDYKANRPPMPDELRQQIAPLHEIVKAMGFPLLCIEGVEADDVIGTLAKQAEENNLKTLIVTGDKDMAQLVNEHTTLVNTMTHTTMDIDGVKAKFQVTPEQIVDYLTLIGDTSDNVPGVAKVGPKTAVKWLQEHETLDNIIAKADSFGGKVGENLRNHLDFLPTGKELITIKCDVELPVKVTELDLKQPDQEKLKALYTQAEFKSWTSEVSSGTAAIARPTKRFSMITDEETFDQWFTKLEKQDLIAFDTETTSLDPMQADLVGLSFAFADEAAVYIPVAHDYPDAPPQLTRDWVLKQLKPIFENAAIKKIGQHIKYDANVLSRYGINVQGMAYDTMLESYILNSTATRHDMDTLALKYLDYQTIPFETVAGKGAKQVTFNNVDLDKACDYAAEDADCTLKLHKVFWPDLQKESELEKLFTEIEMPLVPVLAKIEQTGVLVDSKLLQQQSASLEKRLLELEKETYNLAGEEFNLSSPKQLQEILFEKLKLPILQKTPKGAASTAEPVLQELAHEFELPRLILEFRSLSKLKSTYTDKLPEQVNPHTGRIHTSYHQATTATGRLSSSNPNLQNIPVRTEEGRKIRAAFIAPKGYKIMSADYSQIELRIMAHLSQDKGLLSAFQNGLDIHSATAAEIFGEKLEDVTSDQRRSAKAINFGLIYGMSAFGLSKQLGIDRKDAQIYIDRYFARYPGVKTYMDEIIENAHKDGVVKTLYGRRLYLPEINSKHIPRQKAAERTAINAPMQGTAADIIKIAMIKTLSHIERENLNVRMIMQVHDELVFEVSEDTIDKAKEMINSCMGQAAKLSVPLIVDIGCGDNWDEAH